MKKIFLALSLFLLNSCKSQNNSNMIIPKIDKSFEKYQELPINAINQENSFVKRGFSIDHKYIEIFYNSNSTKIIIVTFRNSFFSIYKEYYSNNNIKSKGLRFNNNHYRNPFQKGIWYEFDEQGNLIKEIDYDKPFKFTFEDIVKFCERENIPLTKGPIMQSTGFHTTIRRSVENNKAIWQIEWLKKPDIIEKILLDGVTGEVISKKDMKYINN